MGLPQSRGSQFKPPIPPSPRPSPPLPPLLPVSLKPMPVCCTLPASLSHARRPCTADLGPPPLLGVLPGADPTPLPSLLPPGAAVPLSDADILAALHPQRVVPAWTFDSPRKPSPTPLDDDGPSGSQTQGSRSASDSSPSGLAAISSESSADPADIVAELGHQELVDPAPMVDLLVEDSGDMDAGTRCACRRGRFWPIWGRRDGRFWPIWGRRDGRFWSIWTDWARKCAALGSALYRGGGGGTQRGRLWTACGQRRVDSKSSQTTPATTSTSSIRQLLGAADAQTAHHATFSTAPTHQLLREHGHDTSKSTGCSGRQKAATRRNMRREERVTVQGPIKEQQPDGMSHKLMNATVEILFGTLLLLCFACQKDVPLDVVLCACKFPGRAQEPSCLSTAPRRDVLVWELGRFVDGGGGGQRQ